MPSACLKASSQRGVFHLLPDRAAHIREIQRLGPWLWQVTEVANCPWYWTNWQVNALLARLRASVQASPNRNSR
jgi:hypothetical protein